MFECIVNYFKLFIGVPAPAVDKEGGYYFDKYGNICGTYESDVYNGICSQNTNPGDRYFVFMGDVMDKNYLII